MSILNTGKLSTLLTRLSAAKSAFLDVAISSRAAASTALSTAQWTNARAANLDNLDAAVSGAGIKPPITNGLKGATVSNSDLTIMASTGLPGTSVSKSSSSTWETMLQESSAEGYIYYLHVEQSASATRDVQIRLSIDGNVVYTSDTDLWQDSGDNGSGVILTGPMRGGGLIRFDSSFHLQMINNSGSGTTTLDYYILYVLTG